MDFGSRGASGNVFGLARVIACWFARRVVVCFVFSSSLFLSVSRLGGLVPPPLRGAGLLGRLSVFVRLFLSLSVPCSHVVIHNCSTSSSTLCHIVRR